MTATLGRAGSLWGAGPASFVLALPYGVSISPAGLVICVHRGGTVNGD